VKKEEVMAEGAFDGRTGTDVHKISKFDADDDVAMKMNGQRPKAADPSADNHRDSEEDIIFAFHYCCPSKVWRPLSAMTPLASSWLYGCPFCFLAM
jgi:hypothetical protein